MQMIIAIIRPHKLEEVKAALDEIGAQAMSITEIRGCGRTRDEQTAVLRGSPYQVDFAPKLRLEIVVHDLLANSVLRTLEASAKTGELGDGKVFMLDVGDALRIRTGERGDRAI
jgi:nitrogen regulatory protein PII